MLETVNTVVCMLLLACLFPAAVVASRFHHKVSILAVDAVLLLQVVDPLVAWLPEMAWPSVLMNGALLLVIVVWRRELWRLVQFKMRRHEMVDHFRRASDIGATMSQER